VRYRSSRTPEREPIPEDAPLGRTLEIRDLVDRGVQRRWFVYIYDQASGKALF
jgi:hypothetical protein